MGFGGGCFASSLTSGIGAFTVHIPSRCAAARPVTTAARAPIPTQKLLAHCRWYLGNPLIIDAGTATPDDNLTNSPVSSRSLTWLFTLTQSRTSINSARSADFQSPVCMRSFWQLPLPDAPSFPNLHTMMYIPSPAPH
ncbi:hypothetical protein ACQXY3_11960, partial [Corynebacterium diphtheriae]